MSPTDRPPAVDSNSDVAALDIEVLPQPTDSVCGPTCLHAVYRYFQDEVPLDEVIGAVASLPQGGTLAVQLGVHALSRGYKSTLYTNNLQTFDPTWFKQGVDLSDKLQRQAEAKPNNSKLQLATSWYLKYLRAGGGLQLTAITPELLRSYIDRGLPVLAGLSATFLYECPRERPDGTYDDISGAPTGHFVVIQGYDQDNDHVLVADPLPDMPGFNERYYRVEFNRLLAAIHLGIVTYDANVLILEPVDRSSIPPI